MEDHEANVRKAAAQLTKPFWCAGALPAATSNVSIACSASAKEAKPALVTGVPATDEDLQDLMSRCSEASFGRGDQNVLDPSYRRALALDTDSFLTNFDVVAHNILDTVKAVLMPNSTSVKAKLYKLNIYRVGDFFKSHVDTPRGTDMFGSLVVCLPQQHSGGDLVVRHKGEEKKFRWAAKSSEAVQWVAFYSDCEHEILPVLSGCRITLTYNLYADNIEFPIFLNTTTDMSCVLAKAILSPSFMASGGMIGFACTHKYPFAKGDKTAEIPHALKGQDALCYSLLTNVGLATSVQAIWNFSEKLEKIIEELEENYEEDLNHYPDSDDDGWRISDLQVQQFYGSDLEYNRLAKASDVLWMNGRPQLREKKILYCYGNESERETAYGAVAILAKVPSWGTEERKVLVQKLSDAQWAQATSTAVHASTQTE